MRAFRLPMLAVLATMTIGCQQEELPVATTPAVQPTVVTEPQPVAEVANVQTGRDRVLEAMQQYVAPFPSRANLFVPPKQGPITSTSRVTEGAVQLRGVVDVGEPRAILDIEGAIALVPVGREEYGVKVVSIENKTVTLQRGSNKWTASLD